MNIKPQVFLIVTFLIFFVGTITYFTLPKILPVATNSDYRTDYSEGLCTTALNTCKHVGEGCGGGHGSCSSFPQLPLSGISTCDVNIDFPSMQGYKCTCLSSIGPFGKCGWEK